jgi:hypothetical protein
LIISNIHTRWGVCLSGNKSQWSMVLYPTTNS